MSQFHLEGGSSLSGSIPVFGSKNAALPLIAASILTKEEVTLTNIPAISDVASMMDILHGMGIQAEQSDTTLRLQAKEVDPDSLPKEAVGKLRGSILLLGALLGRCKKASVPLPGGDVIGARPIDAHLDGFRQLGARVTVGDREVSIDGSNMQAGTVVLREFSVTATENIMIAAASLPGTTTIHIAAAEPHVEALGELLTLMGARVTGYGTHTISITGSEHLTGISFTNIPDMLEAGLFILLAAATQSTVTVEHVPTGHLRLFFKKLDDIGIAYDIASPEEAESAVTVRPSKLKAFSVQTLPYPGVPTDLQAPFSVIATQADGSSLIHDPMYEGRFKHVTELQKMGAKAVVCDPHRVIINGPTKLMGRRIPSLDIRSGATLLMAGLIAKGETIIDEAEIIDRGYAHLESRLQSIGALISRTN